MPTEILNQELAKEVKLNIKFEDGKVKLSVVADTKGVDAALNVTVEGAYFLDQLKEAIPGKIDDAVIDAFKIAMALKG